MSEIRSTVDRLLAGPDTAWPLSDAIGHQAGAYARVVMVAGGLNTGFTELSAFTAIRVFLCEQFPTALRGARAYLWRGCRARFCRRDGSIFGGAAWGCR